MTVNGTIEAQNDGDNKLNDLEAQNDGDNKLNDLEDDNDGLYIHAPNPLRSIIRSMVSHVIEKNSTTRNHQKKHKGRIHSKNPTLIQNLQKSPKI